MLACVGQSLRQRPTDRAKRRCLVRGPGLLNNRHCRRLRGLRQGPRRCLRRCLLSHRLSSRLFRLHRRLHCRQNRLHLGLSPRLNRRYLLRLLLHPNRCRLSHRLRRCRYLTNLTSLTNPTSLTSRRYLPSRLRLLIRFSTGPRSTSGIMPPPRATPSQQCLPLRLALQPGRRASEVGSPCCGGIGFHADAPNLQRPVP